MKLLNTKQIFHRITNKNFIQTFQKIEKNESVLRRHTKISIFEYFGIVEERKTPKPQEILINELYRYINSDYIDREFKYLINDKDTKFKFFLFHISLLVYRLEQIELEKKYI